MKIFANLLFLFHLLFMIFWYGLFFVSTSFWSEKISFHFFLTLAVILHQFVWGAIILPWTKNYKMVCILTSLIQLSRGYKISDERNYNHSFVRELFEKMKLKVSKRTITLATLATLVVVTIQYLFLD